MTTTMHRAAWVMAAIAGWMIGCTPANNTTDVASTDASDVTMTGNDVTSHDSGMSQDAQPGDDAANCGAHTDCLSCTQDFACGWCASSNTCFVGDSTGPTGGGTCTGGTAAWQYVQSECPNYDAGPQPDVAPVDCTTFTNCADCTGASSCGWCAGSNSCLTGSATGASTGACMSGTGWSWTSDVCPGASDGGSGG